MLLELFKMAQENIIFKIGDIVSLKSASQIAMTVENVPFRKEENICCIYFNEKTHEFVRLNVPPATLEYVNQDKFPF